MRIKKEVITKAFGLGVPSESELEYMIGLCAPTTHDLGNRRYEDYIFLVEKGVVKDINLDDQEGICPNCENDGYPCRVCGAI